MQKFILQIQTLGDLLDELDQLKRPFHRFVERYDIVMDLYKSFCDFLRRYVESIEWKLLKGIQSPPAGCQTKKKSVSFPFVCIL